VGPQLLVVLVHADPSATRRRIISGRARWVKL
jgi:hypothetical protein